MTSGLVNASFSLPEWQAVKMTTLFRGFSPTRGRVGEKGWEQGCKNDILCTLNAHINSVVVWEV